MAVNPYQRLDGLYSADTQEQYRFKDTSQLPPHVYQVSSAAYHGLEESNQSIVVSGESGAGKTETVKICLAHLAHLAQNDAATESILKSNPVLEAFGNASTIRNNNSSRFGKALYVQFEQGCMVGSFCQTYLLEQSRVVSNDNFFHIGYQLLKANNRGDIWPLLCTKTAADFPYLVDDRDYEGTWDATCEALQQVGIVNDDFKSLMRAVCIVLQLGSLRCEQDENEKGNIALDDGRFDELLELSGIDRHVLYEALTSRSLRVGKDCVAVALNAVQVEEGRNSLAKEVYAQLFDWLVERINQSTKREIKSWLRTICLLDIFGFEVFGSKNEFEQMCINYANERLQHKFASDVFQSVFDEYKEQSIDFQLSYDTNSDVLDLFDARTGIWSLLEDECVRPAGSDSNLALKIVALSRNSRRLRKPRLSTDLQFVIKHFAGEVMYTCEHFIYRNRNHVPGALREATATSINPVLRMQFMKLINKKWKKVPSNLVGNTVMKNFRKQMNELLLGLQTTKTRYIRCIQPNSTKQPRVMDNSHAVAQLRTAGVIAAVTIARNSFPNRMEHFELLKRFRYAVPQAQRKLAIRDQVIAMIESAFDDFEEEADPAKVGKTRTYFRAGALEYLESQRVTHIDFFATLLQAQLRGFTERKRFQRKKHKCVKLQSVVRMMQAKYHYSFARKMIIRLQSHQRRVVSCVIANQLRREMQASTKIQAWSRSIVDRQRFARMKRSSVHIQCMSRSFIAARLVTKLRLENQARLRLQAWMRGTIIRVKFAKLIRSITSLQARHRSMRAQQAARQIRDRHKHAIAIQTAIRKSLAIKITTDMRLQKAGLGRGSADLKQSEEATLFEIAEHGTSCRHKLWVDQTKQLAANIREKQSFQVQIQALQQEVERLQAANRSLAPSSHGKDVKLPNAGRSAFPFVDLLARRRRQTAAQASQPIFPFVCHPVRTRKVSQSIDFISRRMHELSKSSFWESKQYENFLNCEQTLEDMTDLVLAKCSDPILRQLVEEKFHEYSTESSVSSHPDVIELSDDSVD